MKKMVAIVDDLEHIGESAEAAALAALDANSAEETLEVIAQFFDDIETAMLNLKEKMKV